MKNIALFLSALGALLFSAAEINAQITPPYYNPANVRITGGTINGTTIGATTPATGAFTTLAAGNTAITGTLSSTGSMSVVPTTGTNPAWLFFKNDSGAANSYIGQDGSVAGLDTAYSLNVWNGSNTPIIFGVNNAKVGSWSSTGLAVNGTLSASGLGTFSSGAFTDSGALQIGADIGASSITNATRKFGAITTPHYTNAQEKVVLASVDSNAAATLLNIGGGSSSFNSPTAVDVYAQAAVDTGGGSVVGTFSSTGLAVTGGISATGDVAFGKTITTPGTTGAVTINKTTGRVNFAAAATSLVVTNSLATANSICHVTKATNDATMRLGACVAAAGSFTIYADVAPAAETAVNFTITN